MSAHDVFISYSRKDSDFVNLLVTALQNYSAPRGLSVTKPRLDVFVDRRDFQAGDYEARLNEYLKDSAKLVVICSPRARASQFVNEEIRTFGELKGVTNIIPILIAGIPDNEVTQDTQQERSFPIALCDLMRIPAAIDFRSFDPGRNRIGKGAFSDGWFTLLAGIYNLTRAEVELREQQRREKRRRILISSLSLGMLVLAVLLGITVASRKEAVSQRQNAEARDRYSRKLLYASEMTLARIEFDAENVPRGMEILDEFLPAGAEDFRSFYWFYLWKQYHNEDRTLAGHPSGGEVEAIAFSPDGKLLASGGFTDHNVKLWNLATGAELATLEGHRYPINALAFTPDGRHLASCSNDETVRIWDVQTKKQTGLLRGDPDYTISSVAYSPDGKLLAAVSRVVHVWNAETLSPVLTIPNNERFGFRIMFSPKGELLAWSGANAALRAWNVRTGERLFLKKSREEDAPAIGLADDDRTVAARIRESDISVVDLRNQAQTFALRADSKRYGGFEFSPHGRFLVGERSPGVLRIWNLKSRTAVATLHGHAANIAAMPSHRTNPPWLRAALTRP